MEPTVEAKIDRISESLTNMREMMAAHLAREEAGQALVRLRLDVVEGKIDTHLKDHAALRTEARRGAWWMARWVLGVVVAASGWVVQAIWPHLWWKP